LQRLAQVALVDAAAAIIARSAIERLRLAEYGPWPDDPEAENAIRFAIEDTFRAWFGRPRQVITFLWRTVSIFEGTKIPMVNTFKRHMGMRGSPSRDRARAVLDCRGRGRFPPCP